MVGNAVPSLKYIFSPFGVRNIISEASQHKTYKWSQKGNHYENTPIQIYRKFHLQKLKIFR